MEKEIASALLYTVTVAAATVAEHYTFGRWWKRNELARRTLGIATIMLLALPFVLSGVIDFATWLIILFGFAAAGAFKTGLAIMENERNKDRINAAHLERINDALAE